VWDLHIAPHLGTFRLRDLSPQLIEKFVGELRKSGTGDPTIYRALMVLQGVMRRAVEWGHVTVNPVAAVRKPTVRRIHQIKPLLPTEIEYLRAACADEQDKLIVAMLAYAGLRPQELLALTWYDITDTHILVDKATEPREGVKETKTNKPRTVAIRAELRVILKDYDAKHEHVITMRDGSPWNDNAWRRWSGRRWRPLMKELNMELRPYDLRHTFVSQLIDEGQSIVEIARQAGHSPVITLGVYGHIFDRRDAA
jgi:integrase